MKGNDKSNSCNIFSKIILRVKLSENETKRKALAIVSTTWISCLLEFKPFSLNNGKQTEKNPI